MLSNFLTDFNKSQSGKGHNLFFTCMDAYQLIKIKHFVSQKVWNMDTFLPIQNLSRHQGGVNALCLCGNMVFSGAEDHEIKVHFMLICITICKLERFNISCESSVFLVLEVVMCAGVELRF
jgi:hypothetical protein